MTKLSKTLKKAIKEANKLEKNPKSKSYTKISDLIKALEK